MSGDEADSSFQKRETYNVSPSFTLQYLISGSEIFTYALRQGVYSLHADFDDDPRCTNTIFVESLFKMMSERLKSQVIKWLFT